MKNKNLIIIILLLFFSCQIKSNEVEGEFTYSISKQKGYEEINLTIVLIAPEKFSNTDKYNPPNINIDRIKAQLIENINRNSEIEIYINWPDYMGEIFELIDQQKKETAINIYKKNNYNNVVKSDLLNNITIKDGKREVEIKILFSIPIKIKETTKLKIAKVEFNFYDTSIITKELNIEIEH